MDTNTLSQVYSLLKVIVLLLIVAPAFLIVAVTDAAASKRILWSCLSAIVGIGGLLLSLMTPYLPIAWLPGPFVIAVSILAFLAALSVPWLLFVLFRRKFAIARAA